MNILVILFLCTIVIGSSTSIDCTTIPNPEIGRYQPAVCPVDLPEGSDLTDKLEFGYIAVPEQHTKPDGPVIQVAVARFRSASDQPAADPIVLINGGPGDSNLDLFVRLMAGPMGKAFLSQRDVVIIEIRGLRYSKPNLVCDEVFEAQLRMVDKDLKGEEANQVLLTAMRASHDRFVKAGINLSAYNNVETAADIALVMTILKYDQFNMLAASAGTIVAQHVMRNHPERVRSVILNAAVPIGFPFFRDLILNACRSLQRVFELCEADSACRLAYPDLENRFFSYVEKLNTEPVTIPVKNPNTGEEVSFVLNGDRLSTWLFVSMYFNTQVPHSLHKLMAGDYTEFQRHVRIFFPMRSFSYGLSYTVFSTEYLDFDVEDTRIDGRYARFADGISLFFGPKLIVQAKEFWHVSPIDRSFLEPLKSDIPTLILNGELDHVLPRKYVEEMASNLEKGYIYVFPGVAHSPIDAGLCPFSMILEFLTDPSKAPDAECIKQFKHVFLTNQ